MSCCRAAAGDARPPSQAFDRQRSLLSLGARTPTAAPDAWVAPNAVVVGDVDLQDGVSIFHGSVLRGDLNNITVEAFSNVQEKCVIHAARCAAFLFILESFVAPKLGGEAQAAAQPSARSCPHAMRGALQALRGPGAMPRSCRQYRPRR